MRSVRARSKRRLSKIDRRPGRLVGRRRTADGCTRVTLAKTCHYRVLISYVYVTHTDWAVSEQMVLWIYDLYNITYVMIYRVHVKIVA